MESCSSTRILVGTTVFFVITTVVLVGVLVWRENTRDIDITENILNEETVTTVYPGIFKTRQQQVQLFERYASSFYDNRTIVTERFKSSRSCAFTCGESIPRRRKRLATGNVYHGCCQSNVSFTSPETLVNYFGVTRTLLQFPDLRQFISIHHCSQMEGCQGCTCSQEESLYSAVVLKYGVTEPEGVDETEVDFFFLAGCCKCVNT